jgi:hypothetical protein
MLIKLLNTTYIDSVPQAFKPEAIKLCTGIYKSDVLIVYQDLSNIKQF